MRINSALASVLLFSTASPPGLLAQTKEVTIAHQDMIVPFRVAQAAGAVEKATGYRIKWKMFGGGGDVLKAMASGEVPIGEAGSSAATVAAAQGLGVEVVWILDEINNAEQLVVTAKSGVTDVVGLKGKRIATPLASTAHYQLVYALKKAGVKPSEVEILNMRPSEIAAAWERGDIDAAFIWNPVLTKIKTADGRVLLSSGDVAKMGAPTFDAVIVDKSWAEKNKAFVTSLVTQMAMSDASFRADRAGFLAGGSIGQISKIVGSSADDVLPALESYSFPTAQEQASEIWLGGGKDGGVAKAMATTALFLKEQGRITDIPDDFSNFVDPKFAASAAAVGRP
jgi:taurine transport system substrate-binding protein